MQIARKRMAALAVTICALVALAFGGVYAIAAGHWWDSETNSLTVIATNEHMKADIASGATTVQLDVYKIADAEADENSQTFNYTLYGLFNTDDMEASLAKAQANSDGGKEWERLALAALDIAKNVEATTTASIDKNSVNSRVTISGLENGLYLVVPHGAEADATSLQAVGEYAKYKFNPSLISLPTKLGSNYDTNGYIDPTETITTDGPGDWKNAANIALKVQELSYGRITIVKSVNNYKGEPFTCDFSIKSTEDSPYAYENRASLYITSEGDASVTVTDIPAGAKVTVEESYEGAGYALVSSDCDGKVFTIPPDYEVASGMESEITVHFTNDQGGPESGHGVENTFKMVNGKWTFVTDPKPTPESSYLENTDEN